MFANHMGMDTDLFCHICEKPTQATAGDPSQWPIFLPYEGGNGQQRCYHMGCVILAVGAVERAKDWARKATVQTLAATTLNPPKGRYAWFGPTEESPFGNHLHEAWAVLRDAWVRWKSRGTHATNCMNTAHGVEISCSEVNRTFPKNNSRLL